MRPPRGRIFNGVLDDRAKSAAQRIVVSAYEGQAGSYFDGEFVFMLCGFDALNLLTRPHDLACIHAPEFYLHASSPDARKV